jgi:hypothetical protein
MAQETAGTIGIPVVKNEILPFVVDYAKRKQRAEELEMQRQMRREALKAKQENVSLPAPASIGQGYFSKLVTKNNEARANTLVSAMGSGQYNQGQLITLHRAANADTESDNAQNAFQTKKIDDMAKAWSDVGLNISPTTIYQYAEQTNDLGADHAKNLQQLALSDDANINPAVIGRVALKDEKPSSYKIVNQSNQVETFEALPVFKFKESELPGGRKVYEAKEIDYDMAKRYIDRTPNLVTLRDAYIASRVKKELANPNLPANSPYSSLPDDQRIKMITEDVTKEFYDKAFSGMGKEAYGVSRRPTPRAGRAGREPYSNKFSVGTADLSLPSGGVTSVYVMTPRKQSDFDITIPANSRYTDLNNGKLASQGAQEGKLVNTNFGVMVKVLSGKTVKLSDGRVLKAGDVVPPQNYGDVHGSDVAVNYGIYGASSSLQYKDASDITKSGSYATPGLTSPLRFYGEAELPQAVTAARSIMRSKGDNYETIKQNLINETKGKFKRFKT